MLPQHSPRPLLKKGFGPCVFEQVFPVITFCILRLRHSWNQPPLHYLEFVAPGNNDTLRLGVSGNDVYILGQSNVVDTNLVFGAGFLPGPFFLFLLGEYLPGCFDNIQLLAVLFSYGCRIC